MLCPNLIGLANKLDTDQDRSHDEPGYASLWIAADKLPETMPFVGGNKVLCLMPVGDVPL